MKHLLVLIISLLIALGIKAQDDNQLKWYDGSNPITINVSSKALPVVKSSSSCCVSGETSSCSAANAESTQRLYLSGTDAEHAKTWDFFCSKGQNSGKWGKIQVPCSWELQGYGAYTYGRFYKTKGAKPSDETGRYRTSFTTPKSWQGKTMRLTFEGSMTDTQVWIDGKLVNALLLEGKNTHKAIHQGGFMEFSYDVTPFIIPGKKQKIEVLVAKESANKSVNSAERRADWWLFGGIYRPVYIEAMPKTHIENLILTPSDYGGIDASMCIVHSDSNSDISLTVKDKDGNIIPIEKPKQRRERRNDSLFVEFSTQAKGIKPWDTEHPNLYYFTFSLTNGSHKVTERRGFRTIKFQEHDGIYLNGTKIVVKGTNRHCFWPETGRAVSKAQSIKDARIIKGMNMNAVRCHYPSDRHFLDACDSLGLLYLDELPGWQTKYDDTTAVRMAQEFLARDYDRTCVFAWSNGNEGGWNEKADSVIEARRTWMGDRPLVHPWSDFHGIDTHHYPAYQTGAYRLQNGNNVFMPTEFLHSKYDKGAGAALEDMWSHWTRSPLFAGGFIWAFVDEAVRRTDLPTGKSKGKHFGQKGFDIKDCILDSDGGNGPDGCMDPYRQPEASVATIKEVWSPVYIDGLNFNTKWSDTICITLPVENRFLFTNLSECTMRYKALSNDMKVLAEGDIALPNIAPGERGTISLTGHDDMWKGDIVQLTAYNHNGSEICSWSAPTVTGEWCVVDTSDCYSTHIPRLQYANEEIISSQSKAKAIFSDDGHLKLGDLEGPLFVGMKAECYKHKTYKEVDGTLVRTYYYKGAVDSIQWRQMPNGMLYMDATILNDERGHGYKGDFLTEESKWQLGISFKYPEKDVDSIKWLGCGPYRVWRNRLKGQQFGLWSKAYNNTVTGQYGTAECPVYPEFKGYYANVRWMDFGKNLRVSSETEHLYYRVFTPEEAVDQTPGEMGGLQESMASTSSPTGKQKQERTMVKFPEGDISFLLSIPPMQSYKPLEQLGPLSQPDNIRIKAGDDGFHIRLVFQAK